MGRSAARTPLKLCQDNLAQKTTGIDGSFRFDASRPGEMHRGCFVVSGRFSVG